MKKLFLTALLALGLTACGDDNNYNANTRGAHVAPERSCQVFYDDEEGGNVTQCFDAGNRSCFTLYEPDGDTEYYCNGEKIWEIEPDGIFLGWGFDDKKYKKAKRPVYVGNSYKPKSKPPTNYKYVAPKPKSNAKQALAAASKQTTTPTPSANTRGTVPATTSNAKQALAAASKQTTTATPKPVNTVSKPKVDLTKKSVKPKVDLTKPTVTANTRGTVTATKPKVSLTKKTTAKPKVTIKKKTTAKPKVTIKKKTCKKVSGKTVCK